MSRVHRRAKDLQVGDILAEGRGHGIMSIKSITVVTNPLTGMDEVVVKGPLSIIDKLHPNEVVSVLE